MLKKIGLKNVRSFKDLKDLEIKPITVLCGTNSSGKSTILKSLLLPLRIILNLNLDHDLVFLQLEVEELLAGKILMSLKLQEL